MRVPAAEIGERARAFVQVPTGEQLQVKIVNTPFEMMRGMIGRESFDPFDGMLFMHQVSGYYVYHTRGVLIPLDIVWIDSSGQVVEVAEYVAPGTDNLGGHERSDCALEVPAGSARKYGLMRGSEVLIRCV